MQKTRKSEAVTRKDEQEQLRDNLYTIDNSIIPHAVKAKRNTNKEWAYGYNEAFDVIVISKDGTIGDIYNIQGLKVALPATPSEVYSRHKIAAEQYWERQEIPSAIKKIKSTEQWDGMERQFKDKYDPYIDTEYDRREQGFWFMNNGKPTYLTGSHYFYLQWSKINVGYPDFREANRILYIFWEACKADERSYGMIYLKIRRSGASFMAASDAINIATSNKESDVGILSKTGKDAKDMFTKKAVPINYNLPFFFKPVMSGSDKPKVVLEYAVPATKITRNNMRSMQDDDIEGLDSTVSWKNTEINAYDGQALKMLTLDESGKLLKPNDVLELWDVHKTCLVVGSTIKGKAFVCSTCNAHDKGGGEFKELYEASDVNNERNSNGRTESGLYSLFIPMEWNTEGHIDVYGNPVFRSPKRPVQGPKGSKVKQGAIDWWEGEVAGKKKKPDRLNEFYRQYPRTTAHAFRNESSNSLFNLEAIYSHIEINDARMVDRVLTRGDFDWKDGIKDTQVIFYPDNHGRFLISWFPPEQMRNAKIFKNNMWYPGNEHIGAFGCDSYDISGVVDGSGSNGALHGMTKYHMDDAPVKEFFLEYIARPRTAEIFYEDVLKAIVFYGMPLLAENNKPRLLYHLKNRGYRGYSMNRPDKPINKLSLTEKELGGIPNTSVDVIQTHAAAIQSYINTELVPDENGENRDMKFQRTLQDWAKFDITNRTRHDASISSGLAIMANQRHLYQPAARERKPVSFGFARYDNKGMQSRLITD